MDRMQRIIRVEKSALAASNVAIRERRTLARRKRQFGGGGVRTWTALDADAKLIVSSLVGTRDAGSGSVFMSDVASRLARRVQRRGKRTRCICRRWTPSAPTSTTRCCRTSMAATPRKRVTAVEDYRRAFGVVTGNLMRITYPRHTLHATTSACGCRRAVYAIDRCLVEEGGEPRRRCGALDVQLRFLLDSSDATLHCAQEAGLTTRIREIADIVALLMRGPSQSLHRTAGLIAADPG